MEISIIVLLSFAVLLFILSFFRKDRIKQVEKQLDHMSITYMQEIYQLKKKIQVLEEELLVSSDKQNLLQHKHYISDTNKKR
ncbi:hypothetical protein [Halalkalibacter alkaliphilus]|uniref:Uncharacterized protein n=1 Tax=Halalkalibacter alkaliphilus TaxID=2917993 RepID=A0A9X2CSD2_9BACI|nr:hypothetical protein [Halalkalibacter alkaliphilus]